MAVKEILVKILGDSASFKKASKEAENTAGKLKDTLTKSGQGLGSLATLPNALGAAAGVGLIVDVGEKAIQVAEERERAERSLQQATEGMGHADQEAARKVGTDFIAANRSYISSQAEVIESEAKLIRSGENIQQAQDDLNRALDISTVKGISVADATELLIKARGGQARGLVDLGIVNKEYDHTLKTEEQSHKDVEIAIKNADGAHQHLADAQRQLQELEDSLHGKRKLSQIDLDHLRDAHDRVTKAQQDAVTADNQVTQAKAEEKATGDKLTMMYADLDSKIKGGRKSTDDMTQANNRLNNDWQDMANRIGPPLLDLLDKIVTTLDQWYQGLDAFGHNDTWWHNFNDGLINILKGAQNVMAELNNISQWVSGNAEAKWFQKAVSGDFGTGVERPGAQANSRSGGVGLPPPTYSAGAGYGAGDSSMAPTVIHVHVAGSVTSERALVDAVREGIRQREREGS